MKIIFCHISWMNSYKGGKGDPASGGGKYIQEGNLGGERFNFLPYGGNMYGYIETQNNGQVRIENIGAKKTDELIKDVLVVWTAPRPKTGGIYIVGWYKNATVYRNSQVLNRKGTTSHHARYYVKTKSKDAVLLNADQRIFRIPRAPHEKNGMGQNHVWYALNNLELIEQVSNYILKGKLPKNESKPKLQGRVRQMDPLKKVAVEKAAINCVIKHYLKLGYHIDSVEKDNVGWDLNAEFNKTVLRLEVKGLSGDVFAAELTPNEFKTLENDSKTRMDSYRICLVTNALIKPTLKIFAYKSELKCWMNDSGGKLQFEKIISARIFEL